MASTTKVNCDQYYWLLLEEPRSFGSTSGSESNRGPHGSSSSSPTAIVELVALASWAVAAR